jgi:ABC-type phosphate transport system substrate-binding protein
MRALIEANSKDRPFRMAMSDGPTRIADPRLVAHPVGVVVLAIVVNRGTGIHELTTDQLQRIYRGDYTNSRQLGGNDLKISIVSRGEESGTRVAFETKVLHDGEEAVTSSLCVDADRKQGPIIRCERSDTETLLKVVDSILSSISIPKMCLSPTP